MIQLLRVTGAQIVAIPVPQISGKSFLRRRRFDYKKFYGFGSGDELISGRSTSSPRNMSSFDDFFFSCPGGPGQER